MVINMLGIVLFCIAFFFQTFSFLEFIESTTETIFYQQTHTRLSM